MQHTKASRSRQPGLQSPWDMLRGRLGWKLDDSRNTTQASTQRHSHRSREIRTPPHPPPLFSESRWGGGGYGLPQERWNHAHSQPTILQAPPLLRPTKGQRTKRPKPAYQTSLPSLHPFSPSSRVIAQSGQPIARTHRTQQKNSYHSHIVMYIHLPVDIPTETDGCFTPTLLIHFVEPKSM